MIDLKNLNKLLSSIKDDDLRSHAEKLVLDLTHSLTVMAQDNYYEIKTGPDMLQSVINLHEECHSGSVITGLQTILPENRAYIHSAGLRRFHAVNAGAVERGAKVYRILLVETKMIKSRRDFAAVIRYYYKPQLDSGVRISIHEFNQEILKEHPGHDFTVFKISPEKTVCAEGGPIYKQSDEVGYLGRIWKDDELATSLLQHYETLRVLPKINVPNEFLRPLPRVFIGSSSEGIRIAEYLQEALGLIAQPIIWSQGAFGLSEGTLEALVRMTGEFDYAVLVLTPDDMRISRGEEAQTARDNVLFELGLFMGSLGRRRTFIVYCSDNRPQLPSDLADVTAATFPGNHGLRSAVGIAATKIKSTIEQLSP